MKHILKLSLLLAFFTLANVSFSQTTPLVSIDTTTGKLSYTPDAKGNTLPDFSGVGYMNSEVAIPTVAVVKTVYPVAGDNLANIQNAINQVAAIPLGADGFRGAILFKAGLYNISDSINITTSGIVLRGEGKDTITGTRFNASTLTQYSLINFNGAGTTSLVKSTLVNITDTYVPIGSKKLTLATNNFKVGDSILITRTPNTAWIKLIKMDLWGWTSKVGIVSYINKVTAVNGNTITLDAPMVDVIDTTYATGTVSRYKAKWASQCGVENMCITSNYINDTAENHGWDAVEFDNFKNGWVRNVDVYYFAYSAVQINSTSAWITVDSCKMIDAKCTRLSGFSFHYEGQRCLTKNCWTRNGNHDYVIGSRDCGPNVFVNSVATKQQMVIGPHLKWGTGCLFDNITSDDTQEVINRSNSGSGTVGQGWGGAQICYYNCTAPSIAVQDIPGDERNWAIGCVAFPKGGDGITNKGNKNAIESIGDTSSCNRHIALIPSLYYAQLADRMGIYKKTPQLISFDTLATKALGDNDFTPTCAASSALPITFTSMNPSVATIVNGQIHIVGIGTVIINASQKGDTAFTAAPVYGQLLTVVKSLPIQLKNISATLKSNTVLIDWTVLNPSTIKQFIIERSNNGNSFSAFGSVPSINKNSFSFTDLSPINTAYYRIKMVGIDGSITYSNSLLVEKETNKGISIYPNPINSHLSIAGLGGKSNLKITNTEGKKVFEQSTTANNLTISLSGLKAGVYFLSFTDELGSIKVKRFIKE